MEPLAADDPRQVGVYRLQSRLGAGGMGRVYLGYSPGGRAVAVKIVHPDLARDPEFMTRFRREVAAAEAVSGAYTAPVVGAGPGDSPPWLATAFVAGPSLAELVAGAGPLPEAAVWRLAGGLIEALQAIHGRGLVHRDLKPGNILLAVDGPRVIDFGISRALQGTAVTATHTTMGTPAYMSPEQVEGGEIGPPGDVFALGSVLAFAASGRAPFDGGEMLAIAYRVVHGQPDLSRLPAGLRDLVGGCLAKDPASRPSLAALMEAVVAGSASFPAVPPGRFWPDPVDSLVAGQAASVPASVPAPVPAAVPGEGTAAGRGHPAAATHTVLPAVTPAPGPYPAPGPATAPPRRRRASRWLVVTGAAAVLAAALGGILAAVLSSRTSVLTPRVTTTTTPPARQSAALSQASSPAASPSAATPPAATTTPATPLIAVTVCAVPADGCTLPGSSQFMEVRPKEISVSGDSSGFVTKLVWSGWGAARASATGTLELDDCNPNCAQGTYTGYPATVTLAGLTPYGTGLEAYSTIVVQAPSAPVTTYTYTKDTVPR